MNVNDRICQSCAMPLSQDPKGGGTEADGSISADYCSYCYEDGAFRGGNTSMTEFVARLQGIMGGLDLPSEVAERTVAILPTLKRWRA